MKTNDTQLLDRLTVSEAAGYLRLSRVRLDKWRSERKGPVFLKVGGRVFYRRSDLDEFLSLCVVKTSA